MNIFSNNYSILTNNWKNYKTQTRSEFGLQTRKYFLENLEQFIITEENYFVNDIKRLNNEPYKFHVRVYDVSGKLIKSFKASC